MGQTQKCSSSRNVMVIKMNKLSRKVGITEDLQSQHGTPEDFKLQA